jgi:hypothetical protein
MSDEINELYNALFSKEKLVEEVMDEISEDLEKLKGVIFKTPQRIAGSETIIKDAAPYRLSSLCNYNIPRDVLLKKRQLLMTLIDGVNDKVSFANMKPMPTIVPGQKFIPKDNVKIFSDIVFDGAYTSESVIRSNNIYLGVDEYIPRVSEGIEIDFDTYSENISEEDIADDSSTGSKVERCDTKFIRYLDDEKKIKVEVTFNPLCNQIAFYLFVKEDVEEEDGTKENKFLCQYRSFYKIDNGKIIFRPYYNSKINIPAAMKKYRFKRRSLVNYIKSINDEKIFNKVITIDTTYEEITELAKGNFDKTYFITNLIGATSHQLDIKKDSLRKKFKNYQNYGKEDDKLDINNFDVQIDIIMMGSDNLHPEHVKTIKRFCKLDYSMQLTKHREIQQKLISRDLNIPGSGFDVVFDATSWVKKEMEKFEEKEGEKINKILKKDPSLKAKLNFLLEVKRASTKRSFEEAFKRKYEKNDLILVNKEYEIYNPIDFAYFRPFTLSDILSTRFRNKPLYEKLGLTEELNQAKLQNLFDRIEKLRSFVFTFVSMYYEFERNPSSIILKRTGKGVIVRDGKKAVTTKIEKLISIPSYGIYPNQLYSDDKNVIAKKYIKYFTIFEQDGKDNLVDYLVNESRPDEQKKAISLKFLELVEGIINPREIGNYPYISPTELFQPNLEIALIRGVGIESAYKALTSKNIMYEKVEAIDVEDIMETKPTSFLVLDMETYKERVRTMSKLPDWYCKACSSKEVRFEDGEKICTICSAREPWSTVGVNDDDSDADMSGPIQWEQKRNNVKDSNIKESFAMKKVTDKWATHLEYLLVPKEDKAKVQDKRKGLGEGEVGVRHKKVSKPKFEQVSIKDVKSHINSFKSNPDKFNYELARILLEFQGQIKKYLEELERKSKRQGDALTEEDDEIYRGYFRGTSKEVKDAIVKILKNFINDDKMPEILKRPEGAPLEKSEDRTIIDKSNKLKGSKEFIAKTNLNRIIDSLKAIPDQDAIICSWIITLTKGEIEWPKGSGVIRHYNKEIEAYIGHILDDFRENVQPQESEGGIAQDILADNTDKNIEALEQISKNIKITKIPCKDKKTEFEHIMNSNVTKLQALLETYRKVIEENVQITFDQKSIIDQQLKDFEISPEGTNEQIKKRIETKIARLDKAKVAKEEAEVEAVIKMEENAIKIDELKKEIITCRSVKKSNKAIKDRLADLWEQLFKESGEKFDEIKQQIITTDVIRDIKDAEVLIFGSVSKLARLKDKEAAAEGPELSKRQKKSAAEAYAEAEARKAAEKREKEEEKAEAEAKKGKKKGGADYDKYMKYKFKYLKLKELFKNAM